MVWLTRWIGLLREQKSHAWNQVGTENPIHMSTQSKGDLKLSKQRWRERKLEECQPDPPRVTSRSLSWGSFLLCPRYPCYSLAASICIKFIDQYLVTLPQFFQHPESGEKAVTQPMTSFVNLQDAQCLALIVLSLFPCI